MTEPPFCYTDQQLLCSTELVAYQDRSDAQLSVCYDAVHFFWGDDMGTMRGRDRDRDGGCDADRIGIFTVVEKKPKHYRPILRPVSLIQISAF
jgi:hypothetical protein